MAGSTLNKGRESRSPRLPCTKSRKAQATEERRIELRSIRGAREEGRSPLHRPDRLKAVRMGGARWGGKGEGESWSIKRGRPIGGRCGRIAEKIAVPVNLPSRAAGRLWVHRGEKRHRSRCVGRKSCLSEKKGGGGVRRSGRPSDNWRSTSLERGSLLCSRGKSAQRRKEGGGGKEVPFNYAKNIAFPGQGD